MDTNLTQTDYVAAGVPVIRGSNMEQCGRYIGGKFAYVSDKKAHQLSANQVRPGDIVVTQRGTLGQVSLIPLEPECAYIVSQSQMGVRVEGADSAYVYYLLRSPAFEDFLQGATIQTGVPHINMGLLREWRVTYPSRQEQVRIAQFLGTLDNKIELNRCMAETLEGMARAIFKSWFVDFDPVRAKAEGRPTALPDDLAALFPDRFGEDGLPKGWTTEPFSRLFEISGGNTPSTEDSAFWDGPHQWATPKDLSALQSPVLLQTARQLTDAGLQRCSSGLLPVGSLLLSSRAPIGYMAFVTQPTAINQGFAGIIKRHVSTTYAWGWCAANMEMIVGNAGGSTFPEISKSVLRQLPILAPPQPVLDAFAKTAEELVGRITASAQEAQTLAALRDALLPGLISGDLRIADAEQRIAAA